jgi:hypothetical protein
MNFVGGVIAVTPVGPPGSLQLAVRTVTTHAAKATTQAAISNLMPIPLTND